MSVLEYQGGEAATAVIMSPLMRAQKILFVEGASDGRIMECLFEDKVKPISATGMAGVTAALDTIAQYNSKSQHIIDALGFIDRDYLDLLDVNNTLNRKDILTTEYRDIEIDLFHTQCTKRLLEEKASSGKWSSEVDIKVDILEGILRSLARLSLLRAYNALYKKGWDFKCIKLDRYVNTSGKIDAVKLCSAFCQNNNIRGAEWSLFEEWEKSQNLCPKMITRGHDVACVLGQMLRKAIGNRNINEVTPDVIEENLRLAMERKYVEFYEWFKQLCEWADDQTHPVPQPN